MKMGRNAKHDILFEPIDIGPKRLSNRFYQVPHCTGFGWQKPGSQAWHRGMKAEGGWAAVCTEFCSISPEADESPWISARLWDDEDVRSLSVTCDRIHHFGALAGVELHHGGCHAERRESRWVGVAPSQLGSDWSGPGVVPKAMEKEDIKRVQADWSAAARRGLTAGFDIVYVYGAHSYLPMQFLSPFYNHRTDEYGGSLANRARFWLETLELVRSAVGDSCAVAARLSVDSLGVAGVSIDEALAFVQLVDHLVDLWDVNVGSLAEWSKDSAPSRFFPEGYQLEWTSRVREVSRKPIVGVARLTNPDLMADIVRRGVWDIIGCARPSISDPFLPKKIEEGRYDDIRECIGCNQCTSRAAWGHHLGCTQNPTAGEEYRRGWHPEWFERADNADRDVLVIGAGPAGLECAMVLGKRGFRRVHLVDAGPEIGGVLRWVPLLPGLGEWKRVVDWRRIQLKKLPNVEVITGVDLDAGDVMEYGAEIVVVATGASWARSGISPFTHEPIQGAIESPRVLTPEDVMVTRKRPSGEDVLVYDCDGYFVAASLAELLAQEGYRVELATGFPEIAPICDETLEGDLLRRRLYDLGVRMNRRVTLTQIWEDCVNGTDEAGRAFERRFDSIVVATQRLSNDSLYHELRAREEVFPSAGIEALYRIGDCVAPRTIADCIFDGHRLAREIDSENPALPRPYLRESGPHWDNVVRTAGASTLQTA